MQNSESHTVPLLLKPARLSDYVAGVFNIISTRKGMKKAIRKNLVLVNGVVGNSGDYLAGGEVLELILDQQLSKPQIEFKLDVLFEDDYLAVVAKPAGIVVSGNKKMTLENALSFNLKPSAQLDALLYPEPIHRLDYPTSGLLLIGKTSKAVLLLNQLFEARKVVKTYHAVAIGKMEAQGRIDLPIDGKDSISAFKVISSVSSERFEQLNLVQLTPHTGRKHQLRIHLLQIGNPILGDREHFIDGLILNGKGLYLHASSLKFEHPFTNEALELKVQLPKKFLKIFPSISL